MKEFLITLYVAGIFGALIYRNVYRYGPTAAIFVDLAWPLWFPPLLIWKKVKSRKAK